MNLSSLQYLLDETEFLLSHSIAGWRGSIDNAQREKRNIPFHHLAPFGELSKAALTINRLIKARIEIDRAQNPQPPSPSAARKRNCGAGFQPALPVEENNHLTDNQIDHGFRESQFPGNDDNENANEDSFAKIENNHPEDDDDTDDQNDFGEGVDLEDEDDSDEKDNYGNDDRSDEDEGTEDGKIVQAFLPAHPKHDPEDEDDSDGEGDSDDEDDDSDEENDLDDEDDIGDEDDLLEDSDLDCNAPAIIPAMRHASNSANPYPLIHKIREELKKLRKTLPPPPIIPKIP